MLKGVKKLINTVSKNEGFVVKIKKALVLSCTLLFISTAYANPVLNNVAAGNVSVQQSPGNTQINQTSQQAILNWNSFNIGASEQTHFQQPAGGVALNRIDPNQGASQIFGHLSATGKIILVNQAGIFFGSGAHVDVGGIIATTSDISDQNFLAGKYTFDRPSAYGGSIVNRGTIIAAENGLVALAGTSVSNEGLIRANTGHVVLASGNKFTVDLSGDQLINFAIDEGTSIAGKSPVDGSTMRDGVSNSGKIIANGGQIILSANVAKEVVDHAINMSGVAVAHSVSEKNGEIILAAEGDATVEVSGKMNVSGRGKGTTGGTVKVLAKHIRVESPAVIKANGDAGGGTILIGGNAHGAGPEPNALDTYVGSGTFLQANALNTGNGGTIVIWSDDTTNVGGSHLSAKGGALSGDGGYIETSGKNNLNLDYQNLLVSASAANGKSGQWLLDPTDITIDDSAAATYSSTLNGGTDVTVQTSASGGQNGDITFTNGSTAISWSTSNAFTASAINNIIFSTSATDRIVNSGGGSVKLIADSDGNGSGTVTFYNGSTRQVNLTGGGDARIYYNVSDYASPTNYSSNFSVTGGSSQFAAAFMLVNSLGTSSDATTVKSLGAISNNSSIWGQNFALATNIDATNTNNGTGWSASGFSPIGTSSTNYTGYFDGLGHTISNLFINRNITDVGLFGFVKGTAGTNSISNLTLSNITLKQDVNNGHLGGVVGELALGNISNASVTGTSAITEGSSTSSGNTDYVGGIVGLLTTTSGTTSSNASTISKSNSNATVLNHSLGDQGGIVGEALGTSTSNRVTISNSYNTGSVTNDNTGNDANNFGVGGIAGQSFFGATSGSYNTGAITGNITEIGGLIGTFDGSTITTSYNHGAVANVGTPQCCIMVGGIVGRSGVASGNNSITYTFNDGPITFTFNSNRVGGIVGSFENGGTISNNYNLGNIIPISGNNGSTIGGIVGDLDSGTVTFSNNFNVGYINPQSNTNVGSLEGTKGTSTVTYSNNYFDYQTSGFSSSSNGSGSGTASGTPETDANMKLQSTFSGFTFDSSNWGIIGNSGSYPYLTQIFTSTPRAIFGTTNASTNTTVTLADNGTALTAGNLTQATNSTYNNGTFYFLEGGSVIANSDDLLAYLASSGGSAVTVAPSATGSISGLALNTGTVNVGDANTNTITNAILSTAAGSLGSSNTLYTVSGGALTLNTGSSTNLSTTSTTTYNVAGNITANNGTITFNGPATIASGAPTITSSGSQSYNGAVTLSDNLTLASSNNGITFGSSGTVNGAKTLTINNSSGTITLNGIIGGSNPLSSLSIGTGDNTTINTSGITTTGTQTYTGAVTLGTASTLSASSLTFGGGIANGGNTLTLSNSGSTSLSGLSGSGGLTMSGSGTLTLSSNTYTGVTTINSGKIALSADSGLGNAPGTATAGQLVLNGGILENTSSFTLNSNRGISLGSSGGIFSPDSGMTLTYGGIIAGSGNLTQAGAGTSILTGSNSYTGSTSVNAGTLSLASAGALGTNATGTSGVTVGSSGTLGISGITLSNSNATVNLSGALSSSGTSVLGNGFTLNNGHSISSTGTLTLNGILSGSNGLSTAGSGTVVLGAAENYTGTTSVTAGTLQMGIANAISSSSPVSVSSGATFALASNDQTIGSLAGAGTVSLGSAALTLGGDNSSTTFSGAINGTGSLVKNGSGTLTLSGSNSYQGGTTLNAGAISLSNASGLGTGTATIANNATLTIASALGSAVANNFNLAGTINDLGSNTLSGAITLAGDSTISTASALTVSGAINGGSALTLSGTGSLTLNGQVGNSTNLSSISATVNSLTLGGGSVKTTGAQSYSNSFTISSDTTLSMILGGNMTLNGVSGSGKNLTLVGNGTAFALNNGTYNLNSATITGSSGTNSLSAQTSGSQTWAITGTNTGTVSNVSNIGNVGFSGIQTITGNTSQSNTLDFSNYSSPVNFVLSSASGTSSGSAGTMNFSNINNLVASSSMPASITLPNKSSGSVIVITGVNSTAAVGYINDPINFSNANAFYGSSNDSVQFASGVNPVPTGINTLSVNGTSLQFFNMILPSTVSAAANSIASIVSGGSSNSNDNTNGTSQTSATDSQQVFTTFTAQMQSVTQPVTKAFDIDLTKTPIHLHCG